MAYPVKQPVCRDRMVVLMKLFVCGGRLVGHASYGNKVVNTANILVNWWVIGLNKTSIHARGACVVCPVVVTLSFYRR